MTVRSPVVKSEQIVARVTPDSGFLLTAYVQVPNFGCPYVE